MHWYSRDLSVTSQAHPKPYITETSQQDHNLITKVFMVPSSKVYLKLTLLVDLSSTALQLLKLE